MTNEDKYWLIGGITLVGLGGGIYAYKKYKEAQVNKALEQSNNNASSNYTDNGSGGTSSVPDLATPTYNPTPTPITGTPSTPSDPLKEYYGNDTVYFQKGQRVMANVIGETPVYKTIKDANGKYLPALTSDGKLILAKKIQRGVEIGTIVQVNSWRDNNRKGIYYIETTGTLGYGKNVYTVQHGNMLAPIGTVIQPPKTSTSTSTNPSNAFAGLDVNKILKKGVYNSKEVEKLQELLGFKKGAGMDGDFGGGTETALYKAKGVKQIALKDWK